MKFWRMVSVLLCAITILSNGAIIRAVSVELQQPISVQYTPYSILLNGENVVYEALILNNNHFIRLRDLAYSLSGTEKQFDVSWVGETNTVMLNGGKPYTPIGVEMTMLLENNNQYPVWGSITTPTESRFYLDDAEFQTIAYNIFGYHYVRLRDFARVFNFKIDWNGEENLIRVSTPESYTGEANEREEPQNEIGNYPHDAYSYMSFLYMVNDAGAVEIIRYMGNEERVVIPETIKNQPVRVLQQGAFYPFEASLTGGRPGLWTSNLSSVVIPDSVTMIGDAVFSQCYNLTHITIGSGLTKIAEYAFVNADSLITIDVSPDNPAFLSEDGVLYNIDKTEAIWSSLINPFE